MAKKTKKKKSKKSSTCRRTTIKFKTRHGVVSFPGRTGGGCGPRTKPKTSHLAPYQDTFTDASKNCKGDADFRRCVSKNVKALNREL